MTIVERALWLRSGGQAIEIRGTVREVVTRTASGLTTR
ncbi:hypothetical protein H4W33_001768 [Kibdelosporangium phytohabitans]|nr:hypothetical protein [Kibdelosporangium phytohabitans]